MFTVHMTLTKSMEGDRVSTWRFVQTDEGYCAIGGNYKLIQYRDRTSMDKSIAWYLDKGYAPVTQPVAA